MSNIGRTALIWALIFLAVVVGMHISPTMFTSIAAVDTTDLTPFNATLVKIFPWAFIGFVGLLIYLMKKKV